MSAYNKGWDYAAANPYAPAHEVETAARWRTDNPAEFIRGFREKLQRMERVTEETRRLIAQLGPKP